MAEELKELIEKIQSEGIKAAEDRSREIEAHARSRAEEIVAKAKRDAESAMSDAREEIARLEQGSKNSIKQAARDTLLSLRREMQSLLERIVAMHVHKAMSPEDLAKILVTIIHGCSSKDKENVIVSVRKEDLARVEKALFAELGHEIKKGVVLKASAEMHGGFTLSYDNGRSYFDFSDKALAEYVAAQLKPALANIMNEVSSQ